MLGVENDPPGRIRVKVVYFAQARELAGLKEDELMLTIPASIRSLFSKMLNVHPEMGKIIEIIRPLVNGRLATDDAVLNDGDRVAIVPPVAGGSTSRNSLTQGSMLSGCARCGRLSAEFFSIVRREWKI